MDNQFNNIQNDLVVLNSKIKDFKNYGLKEAEAERNLGISNTNITHCCKGRAKTAGGYIWRYVNE